MALAFFAGSFIGEQSMSAVIAPLAAHDRGKDGLAPAPLLLCFSHLRWDFVFQRPQHLMTRFARTHRVIVWEEPRHSAEQASPTLKMTECDDGILVVTPLLPSALKGDRETAALRDLLDAFIAKRGAPQICWYYTPMMLPFTSSLTPACTVYDCMDELANFKGAPPGLLDLERALLAKADLVFTGGYSLYEAKRSRHPRVHAFPSSVDRQHFERARSALAEPDDQAPLPGPRFGYYGVIDERLDLSLIAALADAHPDWSIVMVGPLAKIARASLPRRPNISWLGQKPYEALPAYLSGWDVALMPFAINAATRFISPTKTPEYLAAGVPVVSTAVADVVRHYSAFDGVRIATGAGEFVDACEEALALRHESDGSWLTEADAGMRALSWDNVQREMGRLIDDVVAEHATDKHYEYLVVGAGFAGAVMAERLASQAGKRVLVIDRRPHIGGNAYDLLNASGILYHQYGPHIFHTNSKDVFDYLSKFTAWRPYEHRVLADIDGKLVPMPINRTTMNLLYDLDLDSDEAAEEWLAGRAEPVEVVRTSADVVISKVGRELYEMFFQGYTRKQWGMDPSELDKSVTARVPTRTDTDDRYFTDTYQAMPRDGYTAMFEKMLAHPNIDVRLATEFADIDDGVDYDNLVFTGPIDEYFGHRFGKLPYRSLKFRHETVDTEWFQPVGVVNYPSPSVAYTRITEYKYLTGQQSPVTSITYEIPSAEGDPYYPIPRPENQALFKRYEALADAEPDVTFVGRLATYRYYNMDQVVAQALAVFRKLVAAEAELGSVKTPVLKRLAS